MVEAALTVGQLRAFLERAQEAGVPDDAEVSLEVHPDHDDRMRHAAVLQANPPVVQLSSEDPAPWLDPVAYNARNP